MRQREEKMRAEEPPELQLTRSQQTHWNHLCVYERDRQSSFQFSYKPFTSSQPQPVSAQPGINTMNFFLTSFSSFGSGPSPEELKCKQNQESRGDIYILWIAKVRYFIYYHSLGWMYLCRLWLRPYCVRYSTNAEQEPCPAGSSTGQTKDGREKAKEEGKRRSLQKKTGNSKAMDKWGGETKLHVSPDKESQKVFLVLDEKFRALTHLPWLSQYRHSHVKQQLLHLPMPHILIQNMTATWSEHSVTWIAMVEHSGAASLQDLPCFSLTWNCRALDWSSLEHTGEYW